MTSRSRTERRARLSAAIDRLAALIEDGELLAASDPAALLHAAADLIEQQDRLRAKIDRLEAWLMRIDGGDRPCHDAATLQGWAMRALRGDEIRETT